MPLHEPVAKLEERMAKMPDPEEIKVRSRKGSFMLSAAVALCVAIFVALLFGAVQIIIHNNNVQTNRQRAFSRDVSCQLISGIQAANGKLLYKITLQNKGTLAEAEKVKKSYEELSTHSVEQKLGLRGKTLINADGTINCEAYVMLGNRSVPSTTTSTTTLTH